MGTFKTDYLLPTVDKFFCSLTIFFCSLTIFFWFPSSVPLLPLTWPNCNEGLFILRLIMILVLLKFSFLSLVPLYFRLCKSHNIATKLKLVGFGNEVLNKQIVLVQMNPHLISNNLKVLRASRGRIFYEHSFLCRKGSIELGLEKLTSGS